MRSAHRATTLFLALVVTTLLVVAGWPGPDPRLRSPRVWWPAGIGVALTAPSDWREVQGGGGRWLARDPGDPLAGIAAVETDLDHSTCPDGEWFGDFERAFSKSSGRTVDSVEYVTLDAAPALRLAWHGTPLGDQQPLRGLLVMCDRGDWRVQVEVSCREVAWPAIARDARAMLDSLACERR